MFSAAAETRAQKLVAIQFFLLAPYVAVESVRALVGGERAEPSWVGIGARDLERDPHAGARHRQAAARRPARLRGHQGRGPPEHALRLPGRGAPARAARQRAVRRVVAGSGRRAADRRAGREGGPRGVEGGGVLRLRPARRLRARRRRPDEPERPLSCARRPRGRQRARAAGAHRALRRRRRPRPPARDGRGRARLLHVLRPRAGRAAARAGRLRRGSRARAGARRHRHRDGRQLASGLAGADDRRAGVLVDAVRLADLDVDEPGVGQRGAELGLGQRAGDAAGPLRHVGAGGLVHALVGDHVGDGEAAAGAQHARGLGEHDALVGGEVDHAVGDDDVDGGVGQRDLLEVALEELDVLDAGRGGVGAREREHLVGHVEPDAPCRSAPTRRALMRTSAPAPEPRSSTVSPSCRSATAVGTPQPSERRRTRARAPRLGAVEGGAEAPGLVGLGRCRSRSPTALLPRRSARARSRGCRSAQPCGQLLQRLGADVVVGPQAAPLGVDDAGLAQLLEVVRERGLGDVEQRDELAHADLAGVLAQHVDELEPDRVAERLGDVGHPRRPGRARRRDRRPARSTARRRRAWSWARAPDRPPSIYIYRLK